MKAVHIARAASLASVLGLNVMCGSADADQVELNSLDVAVLTSESGESRALFRFEYWAVTSRIAISSAILTLPSSARAESDTTESSEPIEVQILPVTQEWNSIDAEWEERWLDPARGSFGVDTYARESIVPPRLGGAALAIDVTSVVKQAVESGTLAYGFLLAAPPQRGEGLEGEEITAFSGLDRATLTIQYMSVGPIPPRLARPGR